MLIRKTETCSRCGSEKFKVEHIHWNDQPSGGGLYAYVGTLNTCLECGLIVHHTPGFARGLMGSKFVVLPDEFWKDIEHTLLKSFRDKEK